MTDVFTGSSSVLGKHVETIMETVIPVTNVGTSTVMKPSLYSPVQNLTYHEIQNLYTSDFNTLQYSKKFD